MKDIREPNWILASQCDKVLDTDVDRITDPDMVAAAVVGVGDRCLLHAEHFANQRPEHRGRSAQLPRQYRPELPGLAVRRGVIQVDAHPPVAVGHDRRRVQEEGEAQAANVNTVDLARVHVIGQKRPAPVKGAGASERSSSRDANTGLGQQIGKHAKRRQCARS